MYPARLSWGVAAFEFLEHTADIGIRARGATLAELFQNAALGLEAVALDIESVEARNEYRLSAAGEDLESTLINWLNEIVYLLDGRRVALARIAVEEITTTKVTGRGWGEPRDLARHSVALVVKAATYHQLRIEREAGDWVAEFYLDI